MKLTIREAMVKIKDIEDAIKAVEDAKDDYSDPHLSDAIDFLHEYRVKILDSEINI